MQMRNTVRIWTNVQGGNRVQSILFSLDDCDVKPSHVYQSVWCIPHVKDRFDMYVEEGEYETTELEYYASTGVECRIYIRTYIIIIFKVLLSLRLLMG